MQRNDLDCKRQAGEGSEGKMGIYLNGTSAYGLFRRDYASMYYVDKSDLLAELIPQVESAMDEWKKMESGGMGQKKELMDKFTEMGQKEPSLGKVSFYQRVRKNTGGNKGRRYSNHGGAFAVCS